MPQRVKLSHSSLTMATKCHKFHVWVFLLVSFTSFVSLVCSPVSPQTDGKDRSNKGLFRNRRQSPDLCVDGNYTSYNGIRCCLCGIGQALEKDCVSQADDRKCRTCEDGSYNNEPNHEKSCKPCTSCDQVNANLEVAESCTRGRNTICRCKKDHYCVSKALDAATCLLCNPCDACGPEGIKIACTAANNTVCNEKSGEVFQPGKVAAIVVGVLFSLILVALAGIAMFFRLRRSQQQTPTNPDEETLLLKDPHRSPHLPEIAEMLGWKDMENLAMRSGIIKATIESCQLDKPGDSQAQTLQLLGIWVEKQGRNASETLIRELNAIDKKRKAQHVIEILNSGSAAAGSNGSV